MFIAPAVAGELVYIGSCSGVFYALQAKTGEVRWSYDTSLDGPAASFHGDVLVTEDLVVVGTDTHEIGHLYGIDRWNGEVRWKHRFTRGVAIDIRRHGGSALATSMVGDVLSVALATGEIEWSVKSGLELAPENVPGDPILLGNRFIVPWSSGDLDALDAQTGTRLWRRSFDSALSTSVAVRDRVLIVGSQSGTVFGLDPDDGEILSRLDVGGTPYGEVVVTADCTIVLSRTPAAKSVLSCLEPPLGRVRWRYVSPAEGMWGTFEPLIHGRQVVAGADGHLVGLDVNDGSVLWTRPMEGLPRGLGSSHDLLYVGTLSGRVLALEWVGDS